MRVLAVVGKGRNVAVGPALTHVNARTVVNSARAMMNLVFMLFSFYDLSCARMQPILICSSSTRAREIEGAILTLPLPPPHSADRIGPEED